MTADPDEVLIRVDGSVGLLTLNRPKAINSLTHNMVDLIDRALAAVGGRPRRHRRGARGAGERGLCAGGDVVAVYDSARAGGADAREVLVRRVPPQRARSAATPSPTSP